MTKIKPKLYNASTIVETTLMYYQDYKAIKINALLIVAVL